MSFVRKYGNAIAFLILAIAVSYAIFQVTALANKIDRDAYARSVSIRQSQLDGCERTNRLRSSLVVQIPSLKPVGELAQVTCETVYPALRK